MILYGADTASAQKLVYDGENRLVEVKDSSNTTVARYFYDGDGRRVRRSSGGRETVYGYAADGQLLAEWEVAAPPTATMTCATCYFGVDHLGSTRIVAASDGTVEKRTDYAPFGEEAPAGWSGRTEAMKYELGLAARWNPQRVRFTGKERDGETGLDYFGARYFSGAQGRFASPDKPFADQDPVEPQSWNLYSYVRNRPLNHVDPNGEAAWFVGALVGAGMDIAVQTLVQGKSVNDIDYGSVAISATAGAVGGGLAMKAGKLAPLAKAFIEGAVDAAASAAQQLNENGQVSVVQTTADVVVGRGIGELVGRGVENAARNSPQVKQLVKEADRKSRIAAHASESGNTSRAKVRSAQASTLTSRADGIVATRSTAASGSASRVGSEAAKKAREEYERRKKEEQKGANDGPIVLLSPLGLGSCKAHCHSGSVRTHSGVGLRDHRSSGDIHL